jgi:diguanylate cyclase (GGDEF)-like protein
MAEVLTLARLQETVAQLEKAERLQRALFAIADNAGSDLDNPSMLRGLHEILAGLMYAENFYIVLYDRARDSLRFVYYVDSEDTEAPAVDRDFAMADFEQRLTGYLIRDARPLMGTTEELRAQVSGPLRIAGADSIDWLGVPMQRDGRVHGGLVVQSYVEGVRYTNEDRALLAFVAEHILTALERKRDQKELERWVEERTEQLAETNVMLRDQIAEVERAEHLQASLYRIAALANSEEGSEAFYRQVHDVVGGLLYAENFYIALLNEDSEQLEFPYYRAAGLQENPPRKPGRGLTEYVMRQRCHALVDASTFQALVGRGEIEPGLAVGPSLEGPKTICWLGAPLLDSDRVLGAVAVQSYREDRTYDEGDAELLTFVAHQIASSLQRRRSAEALQQLNADLEQRVQDRTRELCEQIAVRERVETQLKHQVMHDPLTGLPNRLYMRDRIERAIAGMKRNGERRFALLYLDVDRFKVINDSLGHLAGDEVLQAVSRRLLQCVREPDVVARLSGDEFAILLEEVPQPQTATKVAQRILELLQQGMPVEGRELTASASIGIAISDPRHQSVDALLQDADTALYRAKAAGRSRFVLFDDSLQRAAMDVLGMEQELRKALQAREFEPYFQPLVRLSDGARVGYEALVRWNHPARGVLAPGDFLPVAEECGLIEAIDWQMYRLSCIEGRKLLRDDAFITINVSPRHFHNDDLDTRLLAMTSETGFDPARLRIEVTEGTLLGDPDAVAKVLQRLREACIEAALDDFGTGYSSLGYVHRFPLKMLKIDRSFVEQLGSGDASRSSAVVRAILALAQSLGLEVVAEGIETEGQYRALHRMGCLYGQGYLFGRPQPAGHWLREPT